MKGLLLKDLYMMTKYCRLYLPLMVIFLVMSFFDGDNLFLAFYPCIICGMIPINLLGYDERSRWLQYSETMPYTREQIVRGKYLIGLGAQTVMMLITGIVQAVRMSVSGTFVFGDYMTLMMLMLLMALLSSSISLPFMFKLGVEKGRLAFFVMVGVVSAAGVLATKAFANGVQANVQFNAALPLVVLAGIGVYALSWYLSVRFYKKREL